jgi:hypothetical protein
MSREFDEREFDELVHDAMKWFTDGVDVPAGLAARTRRRHRQRRTKIGWLAAGTAVVAATAVMAATAAASQVSPARPSASQTIKAQTTARVISRIERAIAKTAATQPVGYVRQTNWGAYLNTFVPFPHPHNVQVKVTTSWSRGQRKRAESFTPGGRLVLGMETTTASRTSRSVWINYPDRVWWTTTTRTSPLKPDCFLNVSNWTPAQWAAQVRKLLSCGTVSVQGHQRVDGVNAIELKLHARQVRYCVVQLPPARGTQLPPARGTRRVSSKRHCELGFKGWNGTLWVDPSTYLPVRLQPFAAMSSGERLDFRWLPPTAANLAKLHQIIPPGFRHA